MVSIEKLKEKIHEISKYLYLEGRALTYSEIEKLFFDGEEIPFNFNYEDYGIENFIFIKSKLFDIRFIDTLMEVHEYELPEFFQASEDEKSKLIEKKFLLSTEKFHKFLSIELELLTKKKNGVIHLYANFFEILKDIREFFFKDYKSTLNYSFPLYLDTKILGFLKKSKKFVVLRNYIINNNFFDEIKNEIFAYSIINFLRQYQYLTIEEIAFLIKKELIYNDLIVPNKSEIYDLINKNKSRFKLLFGDNISNSKVELTEDINFIKYFINKYQYNIVEFNDIIINSVFYKIFSSGIYALIFSGGKFPFNEAEEYIKTRPIIYIDKTYNIKQLFETGTTEIKKTEFWNYISAILLKYDDEINRNNSVKIDKSEIDKYVMNWIYKNLKISFYPDSEIPENIVNQLIREYSPLFNVEINPGNLFSFTLENLLKDYQQTLKTFDEKR